MKFKLHTTFEPKGDQIKAIKTLSDNILNKSNTKQVLLGVTGSGKTFTIANVISKVNKPTLVMAHNKTLAAQLYSELKDLFPENRVEYFVSYYDYYQPESYIPTRDVYIEKDSQVNPKIEQMRLAATASLLSRKDVIVVASVSCIYSVGNPKDYKDMGFEISKNLNIGRKNFLSLLVDGQFQRNDTELMPGRFRVRGDTIDFIPAYFNDIIRVEFFGDVIEKITEIDKNTNEVKDTGFGTREMNHFFIYPAKHFVIADSKIKPAIKLIRDELDEVIPNLDMIESHRLKTRTIHDLEMIEETGFCKGIENYSRYMEGRKKGERPFCLIDYFGYTENGTSDFLLVMDESHQTVPQIHGMYKGDFSRKRNLIDYGFRLPSAYDNRPLKFEEFEKYIESQDTIFVSATPSLYEKEKSDNIVEQIIRPTGLLDPIVTVKPIKGQIKHLIGEIKTCLKNNQRCLVTTLTKKLAEEMSEFLAKENIKTRYLHSEVETLERSEIIRQLRLGVFDVLVGINLLREGLDIPEVGFIGILDADKEGFLRDAKSLIQIIGRAARNSESHVVLYADKMTDSIIGALDETNRRREIQLEYNKKHNINYHHL